MNDKPFGLITCKYKDCNKQYKYWYRYQKHLKNVHGERNRGDDEK